MKIKVFKFEVNVVDQLEKLPPQILAVAYKIIKEPNEFISLQVRKIEIAKMLLSYNTPITVNDEFLKSWQKVCELENGETGYFAFLQEWRDVVEQVTAMFFDEKQNLTLTLTKCPFPKLYINENKAIRALLPCADNFDNMTIGEFAAVDLAVQKFQKMKWNRKDTNRIVAETIALIFRKQKPKDPKSKKKHDPDRREPLGDEHRQDAAIDAILKNVQPWVQELLWWWIVSCREQKLKKYQNVFNATPKSGWQKRLADFGYLGLFIEMAKENFTTEHEIQKVNVDDFFLKLAYLDTKSKAEIEAIKEA